MSKSSTVTSRETPIAEVTQATSGSLKIASELGKGTSITVALPVA